MSECAKGHKVAECGDVLSCYRAVKDVLRVVMIRYKILLFIKLKK